MGQGKKKYDFRSHPCMCRYARRHSYAFCNTRIHEDGLSMTCKGGRSFVRANGVDATTGPPNHLDQLVPPSCGSTHLSLFLPLCSSYILTGGRGEGSDLSFGFSAGVVNCTDYSASDIHSCVTYAETKCNL